MGPRPKLTERRRLQTLQAAVEVIGERGLCDTRIADIAERAGSSAALVLYYFDSKEQLLTEALTFAEDRFYLNTFHDLTELPTARARLVRLIELACPPDGAEVDSPGDWPLWVELWSRALRDPEAAKKREALDRRWRTTIADIVRSGQKQGEFAPIDPDDFALQLAAMIDGLALQVILRDPETTRDRMFRLCLEMATRELDFPLPESDGSGATPFRSRRRGGS
jgi:AcrR family transcriptional regulator